MNARSRFEPATFRFPDLPGWEADALTHLATLTGSRRKRMCMCLYMGVHVGVDEDLGGGGGECVCVYICV